MCQVLSVFMLILKKYIAKYLATADPMHICICFGIILAIMMLFVRKKVCLNCFQVLILTGYFTFVISITFLGRRIGCVHSTMGTLFSTYKAWLIEGKYWVFYEVLYNAILFIPMGIIVSLIHCKVSRMVIIVFLSSVIIETIQLITGTGLFEICDLIDNTIGGLIGIGIYQIAQALKKSKKY